MKLKLLSFFSNHLNRLLQINSFALFLCLFATHTMAQTTGDFKSKASGNWGDFSTWQVYNGTAWVDAVAGQVPGGTSEADANNVYLEAGFTVSLIADQSCKNINLNTTADVIRINTNSNTLDVWGKMRFYEGAAPGGATAVFTSGVLGWITTGANGYIRFRGTADRIIMAQGEVNGNNTNSGWNMDFAFDNGKVGQLNDRLRVGNATVSSGELYLFNLSAHIRVGTNSTGDVTPNGRFILKSGAVLRGGEGVFKNTGYPAQSITIENGSTLYVMRTGYILAAVTLDVSGTIVLQGAVNFPTPAGRAGAAPLNTFNNLTLEGIGQKILQNDITVLGTLNKAGTATLTASTFAVTYGATAELRYSGTAAQTTTSSEFPAVGGPSKLTINNPNGVALHADRSIEGQLTLTTGLLSLGNFNLTLGANSPAISGTPSATNMIVTSGTGELRKIFSAPGNFVFPIGEATGTTELSAATLAVNSSGLSGSTFIGVRVVGTAHAASASSTDKIARYWNINSNIGVLDYDLTLQYLSSDVVGTEASINSYSYNGESASALGTLINKVDNSLHRIVLSGLSSLGYYTGTNFCAISNNTINYTGTTYFCDAASLSQAFDGSVAVVTSATPSYQWQVKVNNGSWADVTTSGTSEDYTEGSSLVGPNTYYYHRVVSDLTNCLLQDAVASNEISILVDEAIAGNTIGEDQEIESGGTPEEFIETSVLSGGSGSYTYQWQASAVAGGPYTDVNSADQATYTAPDGITVAAYYIRVVNSGVCPASVSNEVALTIALPTGNTNADFAEGVRLYPNPIANQLLIDVDRIAYKEVKISILNARGEMIYNGSANQLSKQSIDLSSHPAGIYFANVVLDGQKNVTYKIVKQ